MSAQFQRTHSPVHDIVHVRTHKSNPRLVPTWCRDGRQRHGGVRENRRERVPPQEGWPGSSRKGRGVDLLMSRH